MNEVGLANFAVRMRYKGEERATELPLTDDMIRQLAFEAELRDMRIGELIGELMVAMLKKDLFQAVRRTTSLWCHYRRHTVQTNQSIPPIDTVPLTRASALRRLAIIGLDALKRGKQH